MAKADLEGIKKGMGQLDRHEALLENLDKGRFFDDYANPGNHEFGQFMSLVSEIKEKKEVITKLRSLDHNIGLLESIASSKDRDKHHSFMLRIIENNYNSMHSIIEDLGSLKSKIKGIKDVHTNLLDSSIPLDAKILLDHSFKHKHGKLDELYGEQKGILLGLSSVFLDIAKKKVFKKR